ncbi:uncharacterized protein [Elaeis guineensis]|uniref:uncharacterized protein isoform X3 n=1 Tax=Elaeis guineensis var. tenera TaxID=51953 RepID=UPI003C6D5C71
MSYGRSAGQDTNLCSCSEEWILRFSRSRPSSFVLSEMAISGSPGQEGCVQKRQLETCSVADDLHKEMDCKPYKAHEAEEKNLSGCGIRAKWFRMLR